MRCLLFKRCVTKQEERRSCIDSRSVLFMNSAEGWIASVPRSYGITAGVIKNNELRSSSTAASYWHDGLTFLTAQCYYHNLENVFYPLGILQPLSRREVEMLHAKHTMHICVCSQINCAELVWKQSVVLCFCVKLHHLKPQTGHMYILTIKDSPEVIIGKNMNTQCSSLGSSFPLKIPWLSAHLRVSLTSAFHQNREKEVSSSLVSAKTLE